MVVQIVNQPDLRIAGIRHIGPYQEIGREFGRLGGLLKGPDRATQSSRALCENGSQGWIRRATGDMGGLEE